MGVGKRVRLPYSLLTEGAQLALHDRVNEEPAFRERIAMLAAAMRSAHALLYDTALSHALAARSRASGAEPIASQFSIGDQVF